MLETHGFPHDGSRRRVLKTMVGGVTAATVYHLMPACWTKPIVDAILLPAHAATSGAILEDSCQIAVLSGDSTSNWLELQVTGFISPPIGGLVTTMVVNPVAAGDPLTAETTTAADGTFASGPLLITGGPGITEVTVTTTVAGVEGSAQCSATLVVDPCIPQVHAFTDFLARFFGTTCLSSAPPYAAEFTIRVSGSLSPPPPAAGCLNLVVEATARGTYSGAGGNFPTAPVAPDSLVATVPVDLAGNFLVDLVFSGSGIGETVDIVASIPSQSDTESRTVNVLRGPDCDD